MNNGFFPYRRGTILAPSGLTDHLHIICNDPVYNHEFGCDGVLVVNVSSIKPGIQYDTACTLERGDHPFIQHPSYIAYRFSVVWRVPQISMRVEQGAYSTHDDFSEVHFSRILSGFEQSLFVSHKIMRYYQKHCRSLGPEDFL